LSVVFYKGTNLVFLVVIVANNCGLI